jgi:hypothetical protein
MIHNSFLLVYRFTLMNLELVIDLREEQNDVDNRNDHVCHRAVMIEKSEQTLSCSIAASSLHSHCSLLPFLVALSRA